MAIVYRTGNNGLDRPLTWEEVDSNFAQLDLSVTDLENLVSDNPVLQVQGTQLVLATPGGGSAIVDLSPLVAGVDNNTTVSSLAFDKSSGILTLAETDGSIVGVDLDGRYVQIGNEKNQTLDLSGTDLIITDGSGNVVNSVPLSGLVGSALTFDDVQVSTETPGPVSKLEKVSIVANSSFRLEYTPPDLSPYMLKNTLSEAEDITLDYVTTNGAVTSNNVTIGHLTLSTNVGDRRITGPAIIELNPVGTKTVNTRLSTPEADGTVVVLGNLMVRGEKTSIDSDTVELNGGSLNFYNLRTADPLSTEDAVITVNRGPDLPEAKLFWDESENSWHLTTPDDTSSLTRSSDRIITTEDHYVTNVTGEDGIEIDSSGIDTLGNSYHTTGNASTLTIGLGQESIANDRLINSTISLGDGTSTFDEVALGETLNIVGNTDLLVTVTDNTFTIDHDNVGPTGGAIIGNASTPPVNEFVDFIEISETGHVVDVSSSPIDWDAAGNVGFKYISGDNTNEDSTSLISNYIEADNNTAEFTIQGGDDILTVINSGLDTVIINNTSTLDSVTSRGAVTTNDVTVGNLTADDIYTTTGNIYSPGNIRLDPQGDSTADSTNGDGEVIINGSLEVLGDTVHIHSENVLIGDNQLRLNHHGSLRDAGIVVEREAEGTSSDDDVSLLWDESEGHWKVTEKVGSTYVDSKIITENDHYVKDVVGVDGISIAPSTDDSSIETLDTSNAAELTIGLRDESIENIKLVNSTIGLSDGLTSSADDQVALGETLTIIGDVDLTVTITDNTVTINHDSVGPSGGVVIGDASTPPVNEFVDYIEVSDTGHIIEIASSPVDFNVPENYNFTKYTDAYGNFIVPDSNNDTVEFRVSDDTLYDDLEIRVANTADGDSVFDSTSSNLINDDFVVFKNTSTLQSVTDRGAVTTNDLEVNANITLTGELRGPSTFIIDPRYDIDTLDSTDSSYDSTYDSTYGNAGGVVKILGKLDVDGLVFPTVDGTANQIVMTDGAGQLRLDTPDTTHVVEDPNATTESGTMYYTDQRVDDYLRSGDVQEIRFGKFADSTETSTDDVAIITWNQLDGTLDVSLPENGATLQLGQESYYRVHATDPIPNGTIVIFASALDHGHMLVEIADHDSSNFSPERVLGITTTEIEANGHGFVTAFGKVRNINTSAYSVGTALYLDPENPGQYTDVQPVTPNLSILVGFVVVSDVTNGEIFVRLNYSFTTDQLLEGNQNLYFTNERVNQALEVINTESYDSTDSTYDSVNEHLGSLTISTADSTDDITTFIYTGPHINEILSLLKPGLGVEYDEATGAISIGQNVATDANVTFNQVTAEDGVFESLKPLASDGVLTVEGDMTIQGDLLIQGTTTKLEVQAEEVKIADNFILLNSDNIAGAIESAGIEIERAGQHPQLQWHETGDDATGKWQVKQNGSLGFTHYDILTSDDTIIDDVTGSDGIEIVSNSSDNSVNIGIFDRSIENIKLVNDYITFTDGNGDSTDNVDVVLGTEVVITGDDDIAVDLTTAGEIHIVHQTPTYDSSVDTIIPEAENEFVDHIAYNDKGHITLVEKSPINWDVADNWAFKTIATDLGDDVIADTNQDTLTIAGGEDITVTGNASSDTITIDNTSNLDSVTSRGAVTENDITVGGVNITAGDSTTTGITFEGASTDDYETFIGVVNPTADRTIQFPDRSGIVALEGELNSNLDDLDDVEVVGKTDGQGIKWDATHSSGGAWVPADVIELVDLSADVDSTVVAGQPANLEYNNTTGLFTLTLGDYVMTTGDTMTGDLTLDNANLVFDDGSTVVTIAHGGTDASTGIDLLLPGADGTIATEEHVSQAIHDEISVTNVTVTTPSTTLSYSEGIITNTPVDMEGWIRYNDVSRPDVISGSGLTFANNMELVLGGNTSADVSFGHTGAVGYADSDTSFKFQLNSNDTFFNVEKGDATKNIIKALDVAGGSGEVVLGTNTYNTVLTFATPNGNVTIDADARDSSADDITITIPNHSGRDGDSSYHAPEFMLTTSWLQELHDVDITDRQAGSFLIWDDTDNKWVMSTADQGYIKLSGTDSDGPVYGMVEFDAGHIFINDSNDSGATNSIVFGSDSDASIYYDVTGNATVFQSTAGEMLLQSDILKLTANTSSEDVYLKGDWNSGNSFVTLYYNNVAKLVTEEAGIKVLDDINMPTNGSEITIGDTNQLTLTQTNFTVTNDYTISSGGNKLTLNSNNTTQGLAIFLDGKVEATGDTNILQDFSVNDDKFTVEAISGNTLVAGTLDVTNEVRLNSTTQSTHSSDGALHVDGGVGIAKDLNVGGNVVLGDDDLDRTVRFISDVDSNILPQTDNTYNLGSNDKRWSKIYVNEIISGDAAGTGSGITMGNIQVGVTGNNELDTRSGNLTIDSAGGTTILDDNVIVTGTLHVDGQSTLASANIEDLTDNRIVIVGSAGELEDDVNFTFDGTEFSIGQGQFTVQVTDGDMYTDGNFDMNGILAIENTTESNSPADGALRVKGGVGIAKNLNVQQIATVDQYIVVDNTGTLGTLSLYGNKIESLTPGSDMFTISSGAGTLDVTISARDTIITGNLTVQGTTTTINTEQVTIEDNTILLNSNQAGTPSSTLTSGIEIERGDIANVSFIWDEEHDYWTIEGYPGGSHTGDNTFYAQRILSDRIAADVSGKSGSGASTTISSDPVLTIGDATGRTAYARIDIYDDTNDKIILQNGLNYDDAWFKGDIQQADADGGMILDNIGGSITNNGSYTPTGAVFYGDFDGNFHGDIWSDGNFKVFDNGNTSDGENNTLAWFKGDHYGDVYDFTGTIKILETSNADSSATWLDVEEVYADIYAEDRTKLILYTGDANGAGATINADVVAFDGTTTVVSTGANGSNAWVRGDVKSKTDGTTLVLDTTDNAAKLYANVYARDGDTGETNGVSYFEGVQVDGSLHVDGAITSNAKTIVLANNDASADSSADTGLDNAGLVVGGGVYAPSFLYDANSDQWVSNVPIQGQIAGGATTASGLDHNVTFSLTGDVTGSVVSDLSGATVSIATTVSNDSHDHTSAFITDFTDAVNDRVGALISAAQLDTTDGIVVTYTDLGDASSTLTIAHANTSSIVDVADANNNDWNVITDLSMTFDTYGHVQSVEKEYYDLDNRYYTETESDNRFVNVTGDTMTGNLSFSDAGEGTVYNGALTIMHDGDANITNTIGELYLQGNGITLQNQLGTENYITADADGAVVLYHDNIVRLTTDAQGVNITDDLDVAGNTVLTGTLDVNGVGGATITTLKVEDLTNTRVMLVGTGGELVDSAEFTYTQGAGVIDIDITGSLDVDNINIDANTISSTDINGNIVLDPNGSGQVTLNSNVQITGTLDVDTTSAFSGNVTLDTAADLAIHNGTSNVFTVDGATGDTIISGTLDVTGIMNFTDVVNFNSTTTSTNNTTGSIVVDGGAGIAENVNIGGTIDVDNNAFFHEHVSLDDAKELRLGSGDDFKIVHNGTNATITNTTGNLTIQGASGGSVVMDFKAGASKTLINAVEDGAVTLYYNNVPTLSTTTGGVEVEGHVNIDGGDVQLQHTTYTTSITADEGAADNTVTVPAVTGIMTTLTATAAPVNSSSTGTKGEVRYDASYVYVCIDTNTWSRFARDTW